MSNNLHSLEDLETFGVSLVHRGANKKKFAFYKSEQKGMSEESEILEAVVKTPTDDERKLDAVVKDRELSSKGESALKGMMRIANAFKDEMPEDMWRLLAEAMGMAEDTQEKGEHKEEDEMKSKSEGKEEDEKMEKESLEKSIDGLSPEMRSQIEELWKKNAEAVKKSEELEAVLKAERDTRRQKEFVEKAAKELPNIPGSSDEIGAVLKSAYDASDDLGAKVEGILFAAEKVIKSGETFKELGSSAGVPGGDAWSKIERAADEVVLKSGDKMSRASAIDYVMRTKPSLYNEYLRDNSAQSGGRA